MRTIIITLILINYMGKLYSHNNQHNMLHNYIHIFTTHIYQCNNIVQEDGNDPAG